MKGKDQWNTIPVPSEVRGSESRTMGHTDVGYIYNSSGGTKFTKEKIPLREIFSIGWLLWKRQCGRECSPYNCMSQWVYSRRRSIGCNENREVEKRERCQRLPKDSSFPLSWPLSPVPFHLYPFHWLHILIFFFSYLSKFYLLFVSALIPPICQSMS